MNVIQKKMSWVNTPCDNIVVGVRTIPVKTLEDYYTGIHPYESFSYKASHYLCSVGMDEVVKKQYYRRQIDVDKVFFRAVSEACEQLLVEWVEDWKEVFLQLSSSEVPFRELMVNNDLYLTGRQYSFVFWELRRIRAYFSILNMPVAVQMVIDASEEIRYRAKRQRFEMPSDYRFALRGKRLLLISRNVKQAQQLVLHG